MINFSEHPPKLFSDNWGLEKSTIEKILKTALAKGGDFSEVYLEYRVDENYALENGIIKDVGENVSGGAGVRVIEGDKVGLADSDFNIDSILSAAEAASYVARGKGKKLTSFSNSFRSWNKKKNLYSVKKSLTSGDIERKLNLLRRAETASRKGAKNIDKVQTNLLITDRVILVANSEGLFKWDYQPMIKFGVGVVAVKGARRESGFSRGSYRGGMEFFTKRRPEDFGKQAREKAELALTAAPAPAGVMEVVLAPGDTGVLLHEAVGHGFEADGIRKKTAVFHNMLGKRVGSDKVTVIDDGTVPNEWGSLNIDDEGTPTQKTILVDKGIVKGFISDRLNSKLLGIPMTGNGRRQSFAHMPIPRMRNTFMANGKDNPEDIIRSVNRGIYAVDFAGGQVNPTSGKFVFSLRSAFMIEGGKITKPVKGATLTGSCADILKKVDMVGNDFEFSESAGTCGKYGQWAPVNDGTPTAKLSEMTVGGTG